MTILPTAVLTTTQLVGGLVASAKNALDLAKASSDHALKGAVNELYNSVFDVRGRVLDLYEENRSLRDELAHKDEIDGPIDPHGYFFYKDKPDRPLCPKCLQSLPRNAVFLSPLQHVDGGTYRSCVICSFEHNETPRKNTPNPVGVGRESLFHQTRGYL
jgi:hypothetical protein